MSSPSSNTRPVIQPPSVSSCIRLRVRRNVDLPHPDGPMSACTWFGANASDTPFTAVNFPYIAVSLSVAMRAGRSVTSDAAPEREPGADAEDENHEYEDEGGSPGELVPLLVRAGGIGEDRQRKCRHRLVEPGAEVLAAEGGEEERGRLAGDACDGEETPRDDSGQRAPDDDTETRAPAGVAEGERRFAQRVRHQLDHFLRGAEHHGNHDHRERDAARERGEVLLGRDDPGPGEHADDDRRRAVQHVGDEPRRPREPAVRELGAVNAGGDAERKPDRRRGPHDDERADDGMGDAAADLAGGRRYLREERPVEAPRALDDEVREDEDERQHRNEDGRSHEADHDVALHPPEHAAIHSARLPAPDPRATRQMRSRAAAFTTTVTTKSRNATCASADRCRSPTASENSFAIAAAIV